MIVDLIPHDPPRRDLNASYALRGRFWLTSVIGHILWVAIVVHIPLSAPPSKRPIYDEFIRPLESKVLIYRPKRVVDAAPEKQVGRNPDPRGKLVAPRTAIATAEKAQSQKQLIWKPADLAEIKVDVPAPNVVARMEMALPPPPPKIAPKQFTTPKLVQQNRSVPTPEINATLNNAPSVAVANNLPASSTALLPPAPKVAPKQFTAPTVAKQDPKLSRVEVQATLNDAPSVPVTNNAVATPKALLPPAPKKQFTPPPAAERQAKSATPVEVNGVLASAAPLSAAPNAVAIASANLPPPPKTAPKQFTPPAAPNRDSRQPTKTEVTAALTGAQATSGVQNGTALPTTTFSRLPAPPKDAPAAPVATRGNEQINLAIASVNPVPSAEVPASSRSGQFSVAPASGEPSSGLAAPGSVTVPNLTLREPVPSPKTPNKSNTVIYAEKVRPSFSSVFSVPLRPSSRQLPKTVEAQFRGRSVYAVVIPIENLPAYGTDWILWFAETAPLPGSAPSVRAPVPFRKLELVENSREPNDTRLQIAATLGLDGKLSNIKVLSAVSAAVQALAMEDLSSWEWKPATRNSVAISIEAVFEIPFRLALRP